MPLTSVNGVRLLVEQSGNGEPLVLVHGSWDDRETWVLIEEDLARSFRVVSYDRRGHSGSEDGPAPGTRHDDEDDLAQLIEDQGLAPAHLVGNSFGTSIALGLAARRPDLVRSVCGHEPPLMALVADDPLVAEAGVRVGDVVELIDGGQAEEGARLFVEEVALGPGMWDLMPPENRQRMVNNAGTFAEEQRDPGALAIDLGALAAIDSPVLLTQGDQSPPFFAAIIARLEAAIYEATVKTIGGAGHVPHLTHADEWRAIVSEFARRAR